ncbi:hypothetical protein BC835DRAFT_1385201 [Cytidiella melzeri]|nr:hypothetical protein BC835DRAFT_1385201 [Cytidiella melzeri]
MGLHSSSCLSCSIIQFCQLFQAAQQVAEGPSGALLPGAKELRARRSTYVPGCAVPPRVCLVVLWLKARYERQSVIARRPAGPSC